ncbi:MAG: orotidine-5'-phosphate decarboxylase [Hyphomicrobiaceae bacterium]|nr:orotidine-5'-phosphate decarboxylase [Hyphomicrobiaceae bacterium]MCC0024037.1 orotidine-5'-phosphate decarboxylase [Hyphomicrobiaceae bacterium]
MAHADPRLIVALDFSTRAEAEMLLDKLGDAASSFKIGYQLFYGGEGLEVGKQLIAAGKQVFFDLKLLDIDNTVEKGVAAIAETGAHMLTVHAYPRAMRAAVRAAEGSHLRLLGVTVLTSMDDEDLEEAGYDRDIESLVALRAHQAAESGMGGVVCSAYEAALVSQFVREDMAIVTPGIRPRGADNGDQKRIVTPAEALSHGATHLVIGRPITMAPSPAQEAGAILSEMASAPPPHIHDHHNHHH